MNRRSARRRCGRWRTAARARRIPPTRIADRPVPGQLTRVASHPEQGREVDTRPVGALRVAALAAAVGDHRGLQPDQTRRQLRTRPRDREPVQHRARLGVRRGQRVILHDSYICSNDVDVKQLSPPCFSNPRIGGHANLSVSSA